MIPEERRILSKNGVAHGLRHLVKAMCCDQATGPGSHRRGPDRTIVPGAIEIDAQQDGRFDPRDPPCVDRGLTDPGLASPWTTMHHRWAPLLLDEIDPRPLEWRTSSVPIAEGVMPIGMAPLLPFCAKCGMLCLGQPVWFDDVA